MTPRRIIRSEPVAWRVALAVKMEKRMAPMVRGDDGDCNMTPWRIIRSEPVVWRVAQAVKVVKGKG